MMAAMGATTLFIEFSLCVRSGEGKGYVGVDVEVPGFRHDL